MPKPTKLALIQNLIVEKLLLSQSIKQTAPIKLKLIKPKTSPENMSKNKPAKTILHHISLKSFKVIKIKTKTKTKLGLIPKTVKKGATVICRITANNKIKIIKKGFIVFQSTI